MPTSNTTGADPTLEPIRQLRSADHTAIIASQWKLPNDAELDRAAYAALEAMPVTTPGLINYSVYRGLDDSTVFHLSQWTGTAARDHYVEAVSAGPRDAVDSGVPGIDRRWRELATPHRSYVSEDQRPPRCLVVVRQPMHSADTGIAADWIDTVITALKSGTGRTDGLIAATFLVNSAGDVALNLAEWVSADAHCDALRTADFGTQGSVGNSAQWRATRDHPGAKPDHEVLRYALVGAVTGMFP